jgi:hypothetical protein
MYVREARPCLAVDREVAGVLAAAAPPLGMPSGGEERTSPWLEAIAGIRSNRNYPRLGSIAPSNQARVGSPDRGPVTRYGADFGAGFHRQCTATQAPPVCSGRQ